MQYSIHFQIDKCTEDHIYVNLKISQFIFISQITTVIEGNSDIL